jgi:hypothetical protein
MPIPDEDIAEFIKIYKAEFEKEITVDEAREIASRLLRLYRIVLQPLPHERKNRTKDDNRSDRHSQDHLCPNDIFNSRSTFC